jgi:hypothetical protein
MNWPATWEVVVDQVPPEPPPPLPEPQAEAAKEMRPLLSVWRHLTPEPAKLEEVKVLAFNEVAVKATETREPMLAVLARKSVVEARPEAKIFVVVALVPVAFMKVKFWSVDEAFTKRLVRVLAPAFRKLVKRLVLEAFVAKRFVEVALVVVALALVRLVIVEEALTTAPATLAKAADEICWRGERVSKVVPFDETSTLRKISLESKA